MALSTQTQRSLLLGFIASISLCGLIGIYILLLGQFGLFEARVLGTTASIGGASILALAAAVAWETRRWPPIGVIGMAAAGVALLAVLAMIWDLYPRSPGSNWFEKGTASACVAAVALPHVCLLAMARLHRAYEWTRYATIAAIAGLAALFLCVIWIEPTDDVWPRMVGVAGILVVCGTVAVPILHRISGIRRREAYVTTELTVSLTCPRCGRTQTLATGGARCECGLRIRVEIEEEHCPQCGYSLYQAASGVCPECGARIAQGSAL